jgi:protein-S-isoprenylcysteine O-methyltransferase Ste14
MFVIQLAILIVGTIVIVWVSRSSLRDAQSHGYYRFFAWELILVLFVLNVKYWILDPLSLIQIIAWILLILSAVLIFLGVRAFQGKGQVDEKREDPTLVGIEKTTVLVTSGIYGTIRHPFYSSLLFLAWGIFFKNVSWVGVVLAIIITLLLILTAKREEIENMAYFGEQYREYMRKTKMFIPYIF